MITYISEDDPVNNIIVCVETGDGGARQETEHINVVVLGGQGETVLGRQGCRAVHSTLTHKEGFFDRCIFGIEHLDESVHGRGDDLLHLGLLVVHQMHRCHRVLVYPLQLRQR